VTADQTDRIRSPVSVAGILLTTVSIVLFLVLIATDLFGFHTNPYFGIFLFVVLPGFLLLGLLLIPLGAWMARRRRAAGKAPLAWPRIDLNNPTHRSAAVIVVALTIVNVVIISLAAYRGVEYMDTVSFCGEVCHTPMRPEFVAHEGQPHANVKCVECHVAPGASGFGRAKLSGTRRLLAVVRNSYPRPIIAPPDQLVPSTQTCERCHWPQQSHGDRLRRIVEFGDDEKNTQTVTTLRVHVGGGDTRQGRATGVHWHMNLANRIEYLSTDKERQTIPYVRMTDAEGHVREYVTPGFSRDQLRDVSLRRVDCTDCHNRPSHAIDATPEKAVNRAMAVGEISSTLPYIHREAVRVLKAGYSSQEDAARGIEQSLRAFYATQAASAGRRQADIDGAVKAVQGIYRESVFPDMRVTFGTYANNIGHIDSPGCFRCHDDTHVSSDGRKIGQDCETCHAIE
jgi:hypothetical protein